MPLMGNDCFAGLQGFSGTVTSLAPAASSAATAAPTRSGSVFPPCSGRLAHPALGLIVAFLFEPTATVTQTHTEKPRLPIRGPGRFNHARKRGKGTDEGFAVENQAGGFP